jgi:hypothetical protein
VYTKNLITNLIIDTFDAMDKPLPYTIGLELGLKQGEYFIGYLQECGFIVKPSIIDILMELCFSWITSDHLDFNFIREKCYSEFVAGAVKSKKSK